MLSSCSIRLSEIAFISALDFARNCIFRRLSSWAYCSPSSIQFTLVVLFLFPFCAPLSGLWSMPKAFRTFMVDSLIMVFVLRGAGG